MTVRLSQMPMAASGPRRFERLEGVRRAVADEVGLNVLALDEMPAVGVAGETVAIAAGGDDLQRESGRGLDHRPLALAGCRAFVAGQLDDRVGGDVARQRLVVIVLHPP